MAGRYVHHLTIDFSACRNHDAAVLQHVGGDHRVEVFTLFGWKLSKAAASSLTRMVVPSRISPGRSECG